MSMQFIDLCVVNDKVCMMRHWPPVTADTLIFEMDGKDNHTGLDLVQHI